VRLAAGVLRVAVAAALLGATVTPVSAAESAPYEINVVISTTGGNAFLGKEELQVFNAIETLINHNGGIAGQPIKFAVLDDQTNPQTTVQLVNGLIAKHVPMILGPGISATCKATMPLLASGPMSYCYSPAVHPPAGSYMFSSTVSTNELTAALIRYCRGRGWTKLALIASNDATGQDVSQTIDAAVALPENKGLQVVVREQFNPSDIGVDAQMAQIKASGAQVLLTSATGTPFGTLLHGMHNVGLNVPVFSNGGNMTYAQMSQYNGLLPRELYFSGIRGITSEPHATGAVSAAQKAYFAAFAALGVRPDFGQALAWDATLIALEALKRTGPAATSTQLRDAIGRLNGWTGICGPYDFVKYPQRGLGPDAAIIYRWDGTRNEFAVISKPAGEPLE
jgi:branched-chain amino acid transport system substrate-binding protein